MLARPQSARIAHRAAVTGLTQALVAELAWLVAADYTLLTGNGLGFDLDVLAEESGHYAECRLPEIVISLLSTMANASSFETRSHNGNDQTAELIDERVNHRRRVVIAQADTQ